MTWAMTLRPMTLRAQLLVLQLVIVLGLIGTTGVVASLLQERALRDAYLARMTGVAQSVARLPVIVDAFDDAAPSATIQPVAEVIREASDVTYVVVTDDRGIRYSHPDPDRLGEKVSTDPSVPLAGRVWTGTQTGTLGTSWRVKVPVRAPGADDAAPGTVVGTVSVGVLESDLRADLSEDRGTLLLALGIAAVAGVLCATWVTGVVRRRTFRLEPEEIAALLESRDAMLHGISEGVVAVDAAGRVALVNDEARRLLGWSTGHVDRPAAEVLDARLAALLADPPGPAADAAAPVDGPANGPVDGPRDAEPAAGELVLVGERVLVARANVATVQGRDVGAVLVLRDRTELHTLLRDLEGARGLTDALRAQSHEFANTLHVVSGLLELGRTDEAVAFVERVGFGGLLTASVVAPGVRSPEIAALLLAKAVTTRERGLALEVTADSALPAPGDETTAARHADALTVLGNLVDNAVDAAGPGGRVRVQVRDDGAWLRVAVDDDGPGIPDDLCDRLFVAGFTTKAAPPHGGVERSDGSGRGIGLALVRRVVDRRGGTVTIGRGELGGASVVVDLPAAVPGDAGAARAATTADAATADARTEGGVP